MNSGVPLSPLQHFSGIRRTSRRVAPPRDLKVQRRGAPRPGRWLWLGPSRRASLAQQRQRVVWPNELVDQRFLGGTGRPPTRLGKWLVSPNNKSLIKCPFGERKCQPKAPFNHHVGSSFNREFQLGKEGPVSHFLSGLATKSKQTQTQKVTKSPKRNSGSELQPPEETPPPPVKPAQARRAETKALPWRRHPPSAGRWGCAAAWPPRGRRRSQPQIRLRGTWTTKDCTAMSGFGTISYGMKPGW